MGRITRLQIGHDNAGLGPAWHLSHVEVTHQATGDRAYFIADQWLDAKTGTTMVTLERSDGGWVGGWGVHAAPPRRESAGTYTVATSHTLCIWDVHALAFICTMVLNISCYVSNNTTSTCQLPIVWCRATPPSPGLNARQKYKVTVRTSDKRGAGTDADVSVLLKGAKAASKEIKLESSADNFERNKVREAGPVQQLQAVPQREHELSCLVHHLPPHDVDVWIITSWLRFRAGSSPWERRRVWRRPLVAWLNVMAALPCRLFRSLVFITFIPPYCPLHCAALLQADEFTLDLGNQELGDLQMVEIGFASQQTVSGAVGGIFGKSWALESVEVGG